jgi:hypothetical protein
MGLLEVASAGAIRKEAKTFMRELAAEIEAHTTEQTDKVMLELSRLSEALEALAKPH